MMDTLREDRMRLAFAQPAILGEGLSWHAAQGRWWWTDIESALVHAWSPGQDNAISYRLPDRAGSFAHTRSGRLLLGLAKRLCIASLPDTPAAQQLAVRTLAPVDPAEPRTRINDGRTDRHGFFVFGTLNEAPERRPIGSFYQFSLQHGLRRLALPAVAIANSICFSLDGKTMYFTDTLTRSILQCDYDAPSSRVANVRLFAQVDGDQAFPDGSVIDADGCLWNAQWGAARVVRYAPDGSVLRRIEVPVKNPTCPAFGGAAMNQLMVTTARQDMNPDEIARMPQAGSLFTLDAGDTAGVSDALFDDEK